MSRPVVSLFFILAFTYSQAASAMVDLSCPFQLDPSQKVEFSKRSKSDEEHDREGASADVRFARLKGEDVVVKFYRAALDPRIGSVDDIILNSTHIAEAVHQMGYGPKPIGFILSSDLALIKDLSSQAGLTQSDYVGIQILERVDPIYHYKGWSENLAHPIEYSETIHQQVETAYDAFIAAGIVPYDIDLMINRKQKIYFIDFDAWVFEKVSASDRDYLQHSKTKLFNYLFKF